MNRTIFKWLGVGNVILALMLYTSGMSLKKTMEAVNRNTVATLSETNDQNTDFVRHILKFITDDAVRTTTAAFIVTGWLIATAVVFLYGTRCSTGKAAQISTPASTRN